MKKNLNNLKLDENIEQTLIESEKEKINNSISLSDETCYNCYHYSHRHGCTLFRDHTVLSTSPICQYFDELIS